MADSNNQSGKSPPQTNEREPVKLSLGKGKLGLSKGVNSGKLRQSFSHGRSKTVTVEVKRKRQNITEDTESKRLAQIQKSAGGVKKYSKRRLNNSILRAALTDVKFDENSRTVIPVPFEDVNRLSKNLKEERGDLIEALNFQANDILKSFNQELANINDEKLKQKIENYKDECSRSRPNARILLREGNIIRDQILDPEVRNALNSWDMASLDAFVADHNELMRNHFGEALLRAQEVEAADVKSDKLEGASSDISEAVDLLRKMSAEEGRDVVDQEILVILQDISEEISEYKSAMDSPILSPTNKEKMNRRYLDTVKNGAIFIGRITFFITVIMVTTSSASTFAAAGTIASILGVLEVAKPGTIYKIYSKFRAAIPLLPDIPKPRI